MRRNTVQHWKRLFHGPIIGFDEPTGGDPQGQGSAQGQQGSARGAQGTPPGGNQPTGETPPAEDVSGLKSSLQKEREERKALEKELRAFRDAQQKAADAEKTEIQRLTDAQARDNDKLTRLAASFRNNAVRDAIIAEATKLNFLDPSDAVNPAILTDLGVDQDEDDPTKITVDTAEVTKRLKALAQQKPHWLRQPPTTAKKSGSSFGGGSSGNEGPDAARAALISRFPAFANQGIR